MRVRILPGAQNQFKTMKKILPTIFLILILLFSANQALAAICTGPIVPCGGSGRPCQFCHIFVVITNIINFVLTCLAPIVAALMFVVSGLLFMIAHFSDAEVLAGGAKGGPALFSQAKKAITATVIGLAIVFISWIFLNTFLTFIGVAEWTGLGTWWQWTDKCPVR